MRIRSLLRRSPLLFSLLVCCATAIAADSVSNPPPERDDGWRLGTLAEAGFDLDIMRDLDQKLQKGQFTNVHMVAVEQGGKLVYEQYLSGIDQNWGTSLGHRKFDHDSLHDLRSISKSVTAILLGMALGEEFEAVLDKPVIDYFPEYADDLAPGAEQITVEHVLTMTSGLEWNEMDVSYSNPENDEIQLYYTSDPVRRVLSKPLVSEPGTAWYYSGGDTMIVAALVEKITGMPFLEFAHENLFKPLNIPPKYIEWRGLGFWSAWPTLPSAASGLRMRVRDLAKIGHLMLHEGRWQEQQIVPASWVAASMQRHTEQTYDKWSRNGMFGYGYQWWHGEFKADAGDFTAITGVGYGSQRLFVIPQRDLAITVFAGNYNQGPWRISTLVMLKVVGAAP